MTRPLNAAQNGASSAAIEQWETFITVLVAHAVEQAEFLASRWPATTFPRYAVQALIPQLDALGAQGWEPVSIQPVAVGTNGDMLLGGGVAGPNFSYTNHYLCTFKRRRP